MYWNERFWHTSAESMQITDQEIKIYLYFFCRSWPIVLIHCLKTFNVLETLPKVIFVREAISATVVCQICVFFILFWRPFTRYSISPNIMDLCTNKDRINGLLRTCTPHTAFKLSQAFPTQLSGAVKQTASTERLAGHQTLLCDPILLLDHYLLHIWSFLRIGNPQS